MDFNELTTHAVNAALDAGNLIKNYQDIEVEVLHKDGGDTYASQVVTCLLYTSPSPRDRQKSRMPSSA